MLQNIINSRLKDITVREFIVVLLVPHKFDTLY